MKCKCLISSFILLVLVGTNAFTDPAQKTQNLTLTFAGDLMAHTPNWSNGQFDQVYDKIRSFLRSDDFSFVNLETPVLVDKPYATYPQFNVHDDYVYAAIKAGFDIFALANNHSYDQYTAGIDGTLAAMDRLNKRSVENESRRIYSSGLRSREEAISAVPRMVRLEKNGVRIGFVSITEFLNYLRHDDRTYLYNYNLDKDKNLILDWVRTKAETVDCLIIGIHAGVEYSLIPTKAFTEFARDLVAAGADIIWGHHPHVLQAWYWLSGPDGGKRLVMPSMGNFVSGQTWNLGPNDYALDRAWTGDSALLRVSLEVLGSKLEIKSAYPVLTAAYKDARGGASVWPYGELLRSSTLLWRKFYEERYTRLLGFYPGSEFAGRSWRTWTPFLEGEK